MAVNLKDYCYDDGGNAVAATVTAVGRTVGGTHTTTANGVSGQYTFTSLADDIYDITATYLGKVLRQQGDIEIQIGAFVDAGGGLPIGDGTVTTAKLADGAVTSAKLASAAVLTANIAANAVTGTQIAAGAVSTSQLGSASVTSAKIVNAAVGTAQIANGSVTQAKLGSDVTLGGGSASVADGSITTAKLANGAVTAAKITANTITANEIGASAVTSSELATSAVTAGKIAAGGVSAASQIADGIITSAKLSFAVGQAISVYSHNYLASSVIVSSTTAAAANTIATFSNLAAGLYLFYINAEVDISGVDVRIGFWQGASQVKPELYANYFPGTTAEDDVYVSGIWVVSLSGTTTCTFKGYRNTNTGAAVVFGDATFPTTGYGYVKLA